ncbi:nucleotidyltransferase domain-containing protein [Clostridium sp. Marseille-P2415]|uniref:nucleotidyltransferase domain-containing protein n=1 Tax=Clostridium sp. Marseille-P2415 TaxID=1805471 RepID=UPI0009882FC5|nr:nucleotidyltransferase domain-containing protein [Clostridium sp. Marseille-P2415]
MLGQVRNLLLQYVNQVHEIYGNELKAVILYGSYARGDYNASSDVDIMILVDATEETIKEKGRILSDLTFDFNLDYDMMIMPIVKDINHFQYWLQADPFYRNVKNEGVELYVA